MQNSNPFSEAGGYFTVPRYVAAKLRIANISELKVALFFCANPSASTADAAAALGLSLSEVDSSLAFWRGASDTDKAELNHSHVKFPDNPPSYSGSELAKIAKKSKGLTEIINECQNLLGKTFTAHENEIYVGCLSDWLGLSPEYILALTSYCVGMGKGNVRYIEKTAITLCNDGIDDYEKLEIYIAESEKRNAVEYRLRTLFGFGERALTAAEKKHFANFASYDFELITLAYDQMIKSIGTVKLNYLAKILENWKKKGIDTPAKAASDNAVKPQSNAGGFSNGSFDFDDFLDAAIKKGAKKGKNNGKQ